MRKNISDLGVECSVELSRHDDVVQEILIQISTSQGEAVKSDM